MEFEHIVYSSMFEHLNLHHAIRNEQHGFWNIGVVKPS